MKKIIASFLILGIIFFITGMISSLLKNKETKQTQVIKNKLFTFNETQKSFLESVTSSNDTLLDIYFELEQEINNDFESLKKAIEIDQKKSVESYNQELKNIQEKFLNNLKQKQLSSKFFLDLANELVKISSPPSLYEFHLDLIRKIYSAGIALQKAETTEDILNRNLLYNFINENLKQLLPK